MHSVFGVVVPVLVSLFLIQIMSDVLYVRAVGYQPTEKDTARARRAIVPPQTCPRGRPRGLGGRHHH